MSWRIESFIQNLASYLTTVSITLTVNHGLVLNISQPCISGEDPLVDDQSDHDINSVAGVLKLYFRGLENPLFPKERFLDLMSTVSECCLHLQQRCI